MIFFVIKSYKTDRQKNYLGSKNFVRIRFVFYASNSRQKSQFVTHSNNRSRNRFVDILALPNPAFSTYYDGETGSTLAIPMTESPCSRVMQHRAKARRYRRMPWQAVRYSGTRHRKTRNVPFRASIVAFQCISSGRNITKDSIETKQRNLYQFFVNRDATVKYYRCFSGARRYRMVHARAP